jgi:hypothetical protein
MGDCDDVDDAAVERLRDIFCAPGDGGSCGGPRDGLFEHHLATQDPKSRAWQLFFNLTGKATMPRQRAGANRCFVHLKPPEFVCTGQKDLELCIRVKIFPSADPGDSGRAASALH